MLWSKPTEVQLMKYQKGCINEQFFTSKKIILDLFKVFAIDNVKNMADESLNQNSNMLIMIKSGLKCTAKRGHIKAVEEKKRQNIE